jgi:hypothetical protein
MNEKFDARMLGAAVAKALGLKPGDDIVISRDRLDPNRIMIVRRIVRGPAYPKMNE